MEKTWLEENQERLYRLINQIKEETGHTISRQDLRKRILRTSGIYFGPEVGVDEILKALERRRYISQRPNDIYFIIGCPEQTSSG